MFSVYVTGTDTGIGKTLASCALLHALRSHGLRAVGMKPVASGCEQVDGQWRNGDALALIDASARAIAADGAHLAGWIASHVDPQMERVDDNLAMLRQRLPAPCWGVLPHVADADPAPTSQS